jgi:hypothetical protein
VPQPRLDVDFRDALAGELHHLAQHIDIGSLLASSASAMVRSVIVISLGQALVVMGIALIKAFVHDGLREKHGTATTTESRRAPD